jgi:hypothetical protein
MTEASIKLEQFAASEPNHWKPWLIGSVAAIAILAIAVGLMAMLGLFRTPQDDTGTKSLAAALGLVGAVLSSVVALVGTIIKYSIDDRNARQAQIEASRNFGLAIQAEQRNRIEAAIRAVDLLSENNKDATKSQMGGALLALVSLSEIDLALSLLSELWPKGKTSAAVAEVVLKAAFNSKSAETNISAASILCQNATQISQARFHIWPFADPDWRTDLPYNCRLSLVMAAADWLRIDMEQSPNELATAAIVLYQALDDESSDIGDISAACLRPIVANLDENIYRGSSTGKMVKVGEIGERLKRYTPHMQSSYADLYEQQIAALYTSPASTPASTQTIPPP